jgi:DNA polymerase III delta prime subunit
MLFEPHSPLRRLRRKVTVWDKNMISLLIISQNKQTREAYAHTFCKEHAIDPFDITTFQPETSLGIEEVRELQKKTYLKPFKSHDKAIIIFDAQRATIEAQNALLKLLEEPPAHTYILLTANATRDFLPTVLSRCQIISLDKHEEEVILEQDEVIDSLCTASIAEKLVLAQNITKNKEDALPKIEQLLYAAHKKMQEHPDNLSYARLTKLLADTYNRAINTNINLRFLLEHTFLQIS